MLRKLKKELMGVELFNGRRLIERIKEGKVNDKQVFYYFIINFFAITLFLDVANMIYSGVHRQVTLDYVELVIYQALQLSGVFFLGLCYVPKVTLNEFVSFYVISNIRSLFLLVVLSISHLVILWFFKAYLDITRDIEVLVWIKFLSLGYLYFYLFKTLNLYLSEKGVCGV